LLDRKDQENDLEPEQRLLRYTVFGWAAFHFQCLELGEFAAPYHAGYSIRSLRDRITSFQSVAGFDVVSPAGGRRHIIPRASWDLKNKLQRAITDLKMDEWGLNYDDFKPASIGNHLERDLDLGKCGSIQSG